MGHFSPPLTLLRSSLSSVPWTGVPPHPDTRKYFVGVYSFVCVSQIMVLVITPPRHQSVSDPSMRLEW